MSLPQRCIFNSSDLSAFLGSPVCLDLLLLVSSLNSAVAGKACSHACPGSPFLEALLALLSELEGLVAACPPLQQPMRYGNRGFRVWHAALVGRALGACQALLAAAAAASAAPSASASAAELATYLCESFGNATRIDFGTGHEVAFLFFLAAAARLGCLAPPDLPALGLRALPAYLRLCRLLQRTYGLEPAGSHGVWSLDDYHFLPFLLGSSQLVGHPLCRPRGALSSDTREALGGGAEYMYLGAIGFVCQVKTGAPFEEHSPMLASLAAQPSWARVNEELGRLFRSEVLAKLPVAQHFLFGALVQASWKPSRQPCLSEAGEALAQAVAAQGAGGSEGGAAEEPAAAAAAAPAGGAATGAAEGSAAADAETAKSVL